MNKKILVMGLALLSATGCSCMSNTEKGLLGGAGVGTAIGALATRGSPAGMIVGGVLGTAVGGMAGSDQDRREDRRAYAQAAANAHAARQMNINEVVQMTQSGVSDDTIVRQMDSTGSYFALSSEDIIHLRHQRVSDRLIAEMLARRGPRPVFVHPGPVVYQRPVYIVEPPPPPHVGVGVTFRSR